MAKTRSNMKVSILNSEYKRSHGKTPKGFGSWAFNIMDGSPSPAAVERTVFTPYSMTFSDARRWVIDYVQTEMPEELESGYLYVEVGPLWLVCYLSYRKLTMEHFISFLDALEYASSGSFESIGVVHTTGPSPSFVLISKDEEALNEIAIRSGATKLCREVDGTYRLGLVGKAAIAFSNEI